jgi:NAD+ dependent glucose-6-phosphate dehydrogenase
MWLSDRDLCNAMERGVLADGVGFAVLNLMSDNPGMRWDIDSTRRAIGYAPQDGTTPDLTDAMRADEQAARRLHAAADELKEVADSRRW